MLVDDGAPKEGHTISCIQEIDEEGVEGNSSQILVLKLWRIDAEVVKHVEYKGLGDAMHASSFRNSFYGSFIAHSEDGVTIDSFLEHVHLRD